MPPEKKRKTTPDAVVIAETVERAKRKAEQYLRDPELVRQLLAEALEKARKKEKSKGPLADVWNYLAALFRLLQAYVRGEYTDIPWGSAVLVTVAVIYFLSPVDLIFDFIPVAGYIDDAAVIAFVVAQIRTDLDSFLQWEAEQSDDE